MTFWCICNIEFRAWKRVRSWQSNRRCSTNGRSVLYCTGMYTCERPVRNCYILRHIGRHLWFRYLILMARNMDAKTIPTLAAEASTAYSVMSTVECSMMRTVRSFGGDLPFHSGAPLVRSRTPVMLSYSPTFTSWPSKKGELTKWESRENTPREDNVRFFISNNKLKYLFQSNMTYSWHMLFLVESTDWFQFFRPAMFPVT